jgi:hypothetical protein
MAATEASDFVFEPKVWSDHIQAYFDQMLVFGQFALRNNQLEAEGSGLTVNFPYFKSISAAEEIAEGDALTVANLSDDSFSATVFEVGKAVGFTKKSFKKSAASQEKIMAEAQRQIARVHAEKVDAKLLTEIYTAGSTGYLATAAANTMNVRTLNVAKIKAFGDRQHEAVVCFMHSLQYLDLMNDSTAGFLKADANDPMAMVSGFMGRLLGMAIVINDNLTTSTIDSVAAYKAIICKENAYGILMKQSMEMDSDKDILAREIIITGNEWYAVKNFHAKVAAADLKISFCTTTVSA